MGSGSFAATSIGGYFVYFLAALPFVLYVSVALHELGHAGVARLFGVPVIGITIGAGPSRSFSVGRTKVTLGAVPLSGRTVPLVTSRGANIAIVLGGVGVNAAIGIACRPAAHDNWVFAVIAAVNLGLAVLQLIPFRTKGLSGTLTSDGWKLFALVFGSRGSRQEAHWAAARGMALLQEGDPAGGIEALREAQRMGGPSADMFLAHCLLMQDDPALLREGLDLAMPALAEPGLDRFRAVHPAAFRAQVALAVARAKTILGEADAVAFLRTDRWRWPSPFPAGEALVAQALMKQPDEASRREGVALAHGALWTKPPAVGAITPDSRARLANTMAYVLARDAAPQNPDVLTEAERAIAVARDLSPKSPMFIDTQAFVRVRQGRFAEAAELLEPLIADAADDQTGAAIHATLALALIGLGRTDEVGPLLPRAEAGWPDNPLLGEISAALDAAGA